MDRKSCRARNLAASGASALGLALALALAVPSAADAHHGGAHNCGNFDHSDPVFGSSDDGHGRHRGARAHVAEHDADHRFDRDADDRLDRDRDRRGDRDADDRLDRDRDRRGDRDDREADHRFASDARGDDYVNEGRGDENCGNWDHRGKQMNVPPGLFDDGDHH